MNRRRRAMHPLQFLCGFELIRPQRQRKEHFYVWDIVFEFVIGVAMGEFELWEVDAQLLHEPSRDSPHLKSVMEGQQYLHAKICGSLFICWRMCADLAQSF